MISLCPHCGRSVATEETLIHTERFGWVPSLCANGENGPRDDGTRERVRNHPFWYCSAIKDGAGGTCWRVLLMGPYEDYDFAAAMLSHAKRLANNTDIRAPWYRYGIASSPDREKVAFPEPEDFIAEHGLKISES